MERHRLDVCSKPLLALVAVLTTGMFSEIRRKLSDENSITGILVFEERFKSQVTPFSRATQRNRVV